MAGVDDLTALETWIEPLIQAMRPVERRKLMREIAQDLRRANAKRIRAQKAPDGSLYKPRNRNRKLLDMQFKYKDASGNVTDRRARLTADGPDQLHGHDYLRGAFRTFRRSRIVTIYQSRLVRQRKAERMLLGMAKRRIMRIRTSANHAEVGYSGVAAHIGRVHHHGLRDRVSKRGPSVEYPARPLLGFSDEDKELIQDRVFARISQ